MGMFLTTETAEGHDDCGSVCDSSFSRSAVERF